MASKDIDGSIIIILTEDEAREIYSRLIKISKLTEVEQGITHKIARDLKMKPVGGTFTITIGGTVSAPLPYNSNNEVIQSTISKLFKEEGMKGHNKIGTWRLSNEQLTIRVVVDSDNNIQSVAPVAFKFIGQPLSNLTRWMNRMSKTDIMLMRKNVYRGHQYDPMDSERGKSHEGED